MASGRIHFISAFVIAFAATLACPAAAEDWQYWRANDLKRGGIMLTTDRDKTHTLPISICAPGEAFVCMRFAAGALAVPKGPLSDTWQFEGSQYQVVSRRNALGLLGEVADGIYIKTTRPSAKAIEFYYSPMRGFFAFQWIDEPQTGTTVFISVKKCAPGAASSCNEK